MKSYFIILSSLLFLNCSNNNKEHLKYDDNVIAIIDNKKTEDFKTKASAILDNEDIFEIERLLKLSISDYNSKQIELIPQYQKLFPEIKVGPENVGVVDLRQYKRQYVPYTNKKGEKIVWIYCTHNERVHSRWKTELQFAFGGGSTYFFVTINLSKKSYEKLEDNGPA